MYAMGAKESRQKTLLGVLYIYMRDNSSFSIKNVNKRPIEDIILRVNLTGLTIRKEGIQELMQSPQLLD